MSKAEERTLKSHNSGISIVRVNYGLWGEDKDVEYHFRNGNKQILQWVRQWMKSFYDYYTNFTITDNLGVASNISKDFDERVNVLGRPGDLYTVHTSNKYNIFMVGPDRLSYYEENGTNRGRDGVFFMKGTGVFSPYLFIVDDLFCEYPYWDEDWQEFDCPKDQMPDKGLTVRFPNKKTPHVNLFFLMPKASIEKYSNFGIRNKNNLF